MQASSRSGHAARLAMILTLCVLVLLGAGALAVRYVTQQTADRAREIADNVAQAFQVQPKVTIAGKTIVEQRTAVLQFVTLEKTLTERQRIDDSWLHSTKTLEVEADFTVRVGFDLEKPFVVAMGRAGSGLRVTLPPAQILSVDLHDVRFLRDEDGLWNKLTPEDREQALRELRRRVELNARKSDLPQQARSIAEKRLTELLAPGGRDVVFEPARKP